MLGMQWIGMVKAVFVRVSFCLGPRSQSLRCSSASASLPNLPGWMFEVLIFSMLIDIIEGHTCMVLRICSMHRARVD